MLIALSRVIEPLTIVVTTKLIKSFFVEVVAIRVVEVYIENKYLFIDSAIVVIS
jgi:hypothetical protein